MQFNPINSYVTYHILKGKSENEVGVPKNAQAI